MAKQRILLMYISEVSGHHQATLAIEKSLRIIDSRLEIFNINGFRYTYPLIEKVVNRAYMSVIKRTPKLWDYLYDNPKVIEKTRFLKDKIHKSNFAKLQKLFDKFQPDTVACSQAFPCGMVAAFKKAHNLDVTLIGVLTDYAPHSYWLHQGIDYYVVPSDETKYLFMKKGVEEQRIKPFGIPVDPKFTVKKDKEELKKKLGLDPHLPSILIMGGGQGLGPIKEIIKSLNKTEAHYQMIVVAGTNKKLVKWLLRVQSRIRYRIVIFEFANNVEELMEVASLIISKPGGITTAEALVKSLPVIVVSPIPGQEMYNTNFLLRQGVAIRVNQLKNVGNEIVDLLNDSKRFESMKQAARAHGKPQASMDIAKLILS